MIRRFRRLSGTRWVGGESGPAGKPSQAVFGDPFRTPCAAPARASEVSLQTAFLYLAGFALSGRLFSFSRAFLASGASGPLGRIFK